MNTGMIGERTPVRIRMAESPASIPPSWSLCKTARRFQAAVASNLSADNDETLPVKKVVEKVDGNVAEGEW